jgi:hypothetical protein
VIVRKMEFECSIEPMSPPSPPSPPQGLQYNGRSTGWQRNVYWTNATNQMKRSTTGIAPRKIRRHVEHAESPKTKDQRTGGIESFCAEDSDGTATAVPLLENSRNDSYTTIGTEPNMAGAPRRCHSQRRNPKTGFK